MIFRAVHIFSLVLLALLSLASAQKDALLGITTLAPTATAATLVYVNANGSTTTGAIKETGVPAYVYGDASTTYAVPTNSVDMPLEAAGAYNGVGRSWAAVALSAVAVAVGLM